MLPCAAILGLLCVTGAPVVTTENPSPRLWVERRVQARNFDLTLLESDAHYPVFAAQMVRSCRAGVCVWSDVKRSKCELSFHIFVDRGADRYNGGEGYSLRAISADDLLGALSRIKVSTDGVRGVEAFSLSTIPAFRQAAANCLRDNNAPTGDNL